METEGRSEQCAIVDHLRKDSIWLTALNFLGMGLLLAFTPCIFPMIPILTGVVVVIPTLFMGSLLTESFFGIPGLGSYTIDAINAQDFAVVRSMVFIGSVLYIVGLLLTDISYTIADPRVRLQ